MSSSAEENHPDNTHLREKFVMEKDPDMNYNIMALKECPRCKEHEPDYAFTNCGFSVDRDSNGKTIQVFECTRCHHKWEIKYK